MFRKLFQSKQPAGTPVGSIPAGRRIYAIGDIHGRLDLLDSLLERIAADDANRPGAETTLIFLGDLVDRGPQSAQVVERLMALSEAQPRTRFLLGNHEEIFLKAVEGDLAALPLFNRVGGRETALSYGICEDAYRESDYARLQQLLHAAVPAEHVAFLTSFEDLIIVGDYAFVHAGVRPDRPLARQRPSDLRWIRNEFLSHAEALEKIIVHGHTISEKVEFGPHRIGLDTGAFASGVLTAMGFEGDQRWILES